MTASAGAPAIEASGGHRATPVERGGGLDILWETHPGAAFSYTEPPTSVKASMLKFCKKSRLGRGAKQPEERVEHTVGKSPNGVLPNTPGWEAQVLPFVTVGVRRPALASQHRRKGGPEHLLDFSRIGLEHDLALEDEHVRNDDHVDVLRAPQSLNVIERAEVAGRSGKLEPDLLLGLADRGREGVLVGGIVTAPRKGDVPGPRIGGVLRALDKQDLGSIEPPHHDGHRGLTGVRTARHLRAQRGAKTRVEFHKRELHGASCSTSARSARRRLTAKDAARSTLAVSERFSVFFSADQIAARVRELGAEITRDYAGKPIVLVCVLKGSFVLTADLARAIEGDVRIEFLGVQSYGEGTETTGQVQITQDLTKPIEGEHVLVVEDIVDTGLTIAHLLDLFRARKPASLKVCALLHKPSRTRVEVPVDYLGFTIEDKFVVGYGLDFAQRYRNLPFIGVVEAS